jgi:nucleoside-diphosphate-sugar epimerase
MWLALPLVIAPKFSFPWVHAGDIGIAVAGALENDASSGKAYLTAGKNATVYELAQAYLTAAGRRALVLPLPMGTGLYVDCSRAERELGFVHRPLVDGMRETLEADARYRAAGIA